MAKMLRYTIALCIALIGLVVVPIVANAADMPRKAAGDPNAYAAADGWGGFYVGAHGGWAKFSVDPFNVDADGFVWGGHAGINFQHGTFVGGIETGITRYHDVKPSGATSGCECYVADLLVKAGVTVTPNTLVYAAAGGFWHNAAVPANFVPSFGWVAGGGIDFMPLGSHLVFGARYLYRDLGNANSFATVTGHELTARVSFKF